ncbi:MAG: glycosyltransferase [Pseudomonadota bacterium]
MISVSVVIPTYNRSALLTRAIDSVLSQTHPAEEIIVVDDGSTDRTAEMVQKRYPHVQLLRQKNQGVSAARNRGITAAKCEWIGLLDSDDAWLPQKLERQVRAIQQRGGFRLIHCDDIWIRNGERVDPINKHQKQGGYIFRCCLPMSCISPSAAVIHRSLFDEVGRFDTGLPACEDYDLWLRICARDPVLYVSEPLLRKYGGHKDQLSRKHWGMDRFRVRALEKILATDWLNDENRLAAEAMLVKKASALADSAEKRGREDLVKAYRRIAAKFQESVSF